MSYPLLTIIVLSIFALYGLLMRRWISLKPLTFAGILMFVLSGMQLFAVIRGSRGEPEGIETGVLSNEPNWKALGIVGSGLISYALLVEILGFLVMGPILYFAVAKAVGAKKNLPLAVIAIVVSVIVYFGFTQGLQLYLPLGFDFILDPAGQESGW